MADYRHQREEERGPTGRTRSCIGIYSTSGAGKAWAAQFVPDAGHLPALQRAGSSAHARWRISAVRPSSGYPVATARILFFLIDQSLPTKQARRSAARIRVAGSAARHRLEEVNRRTEATGNETLAGDSRTETPAAVRSEARNSIAHPSSRSSLRMTEKQHGSPNSVHYKIGAAFFDDRSARVIFQCNPQRDRSTSNFSRLKPLFDVVGNN